MRKQRYLLLIGLIGLLLFVSVNPATATEVWSDNFDDGNYNGWTVTEGEWDATSNVLENSHAWVSRIWHESNVTVGTWSFDVYYESTSRTPVILFMANGTDPPGALEDDYQGYGIRIRDNSVDLLKQDGDWDRGPQLLAFVEFDDFIRTWTRFDITRESNGVIKVYVNATSTVEVADISYTHTEFTYSERFVIYSLTGVAMYDNITVSDTIDITEPVTETTTTTTTTTTTNGGTTPPPADDMTTMLIIAGGGIAVVVVIVIIVKMRGS